MASFPNFFSFPYFLLLIIIISKTEITTAKACNRRNCSPTGLTVRFPFQLSDDHDKYNFFFHDDQTRCGYPGFELSCRNNSNDTILSLPSGGFAVRMIIYEAQMLTIDDPDKCLPKRFLESNFSVSGTPFRVQNLGSFTFLNCSSVPEFVAGAGEKPVVVPCLSGDGYVVVAMPTVIFTSVSAVLMAPSSFCRVVSTTALVPVSSSEKWWLGEWGFYLRAYVTLTWREPSCGKCEQRGGDCDFVSYSNFEIGCFRLPNKHGLSKGVQYTFYFIGGLGIVGFLCFYCGHKCHLLPSNARVNRQSSSNISPPNNEVNRQSTTDVAATAGMDETTIEMYPKTLIGESGRLIPKSDYKSCPICLAEYQPKDTVRTLPNCFHYFHANCIDEWLRLNATCPLCRNSPLISPCSLSSS